MLNLEKIIDQIKNLATLPVGWDYQKGDKIENITIQKAIHVLNLSLPFNLDCSVHPMDCGGVLLTFFKQTQARGENSLYLDVSINPNLTLDISKEKGFGFNYEILYDYYCVHESILIKEFNKL